MIIYISNFIIVYLPFVSNLSKNKTFSSGIGCLYNIYCSLSFLLFKNSTISVKTNIVISTVCVPLLLNINCFSDINSLLSLSIVNFYLSNIKYIL